MSEPNPNKSNQSFLDKFKGKTNKISKTGLNNLLEKASEDIPISKSKIYSRK